MQQESTVRRPHAARAPVVAGTDISAASYGLVLVHGRGGTAEGMLPIARAAKATGAALIAPVAEGNSWYPYRFLAPAAENEPWLSSALESIASAVAMLAAGGIAEERIILVGFSQGACLTLEFAARAAARGARFGGVVAMAGALVGDPAVPRRDTGSLNGTPVVLACGDADAHIPEALVRSSAAQFATLGATVDLRIYPGLGHDITGDQIAALSALVEALPPVARNDE
ncbi:dienelactone hydrolase family protein [Gemmatimonas sp.]|uniref:alpha/beta hydrolase n=1 Tax=Gemmatimonas sp. TaxID=1962908 RepID=UPI00333F7C62